MSQTQTSIADTTARKSYDGGWHSLRRKFVNDMKGDTPLADLCYLTSKERATPIGRSRPPLYTWIPFGSNGPYGKLGVLRWKIMQKHNSS
jgi:hypothetical protein